MEKQQILDKTKDVLTPFETENIIKFIKGLSFSTVMGNPWLLAILAILLFYAVIKRSKFVILTLFTLFSLMLLIQYTLPTSGDLSLSSLLPFVFGGLAIGAVLIYFIFIQGD
jgi:apolipoprotein N-acyltransferase